MMSRRVTLRIASAILTTIVVGVIAFLLTTNEPVAVAAAPTTSVVEASSDSSMSTIPAAQVEDTIGSETDAAPEPTTPVSFPDGETVYVVQCASCHGANGEGGSGGPVDDIALTLAEVVQITADGVPRMPAYRDVLTREEIQAVSEYTLLLNE